jgi:hypothetical protein
MSKALRFAGGATLMLLALIGLIAALRGSPKMQPQRR